MKRFVFFGVSLQCEIADGLSDGAIQKAGDVALRRYKNAGGRLDAIVEVRFSRGSVEVVTDGGQCWSISLGPLT